MTTPSRSTGPTALGYMSMNDADEPRPTVLGPALVERGYESLWMGEHSHIPVNSLDSYPMGELPEFYKRMMDPLLTLLAAAVGAPDLRIGTSVALPLERDVLSFAKEVSTIDLLTGSRFILGVGVGWNRQEYENHTQIPWGRRYSALSERVQVMRALWNDDLPAFDGQYHRFSELWCDPKPNGRDVPVYAGMNGRVGLAHAAAWANGWITMDFGEVTPERHVQRLRDAAARAGRDPESVPITVLLMPEPSVERLAAFKALGVERIVLGAGATRRDETWRLLDQWADLWARA